jgi:hypothetical protein
VISSSCNVKSGPKVLPPPSGVSIGARPHRARTGRGRAETGSGLEALVGGLPVKSRGSVKSLATVTATFVAGVVAETATEGGEAPAPGQEHPLEPATRKNLRLLMGLRPLPMIIKTRFLICRPKISPTLLLFFVVSFLPRRCAFEASPRTPFSSLVPLLPLESAVSCKSCQNTGCEHTVLL